MSHVLTVVLGHFLGLQKNGKKSDRYDYTKNFLYQAIVIDFMRRGMNSGKLTHLLRELRITINQKIKLWKHEI